MKFVKSIKHLQAGWLCWKIERFKASFYLAMCYHRYRGHMIQFLEYFEMAIIFDNLYGIFQIVDTTS